MSTEVAINTLVKLIEAFASQTMETVISVQKNQTHEKEGLKWKNKIAGPTLEILNYLIKYYKRMIPNYKDLTKDSEEFDALLNPLRELQHRIELYEEELKIDGTAMIGIDKIHFPKSSEDEVYIGLLGDDGLRTGHGALTNGEILYKGYWEEDKKNGYGMQVYENGWVFEGHWKDDVPQSGRWKMEKGEYFYGFAHHGSQPAESYQIGLKHEDLSRFMRAEKKVLLRKNDDRSSKQLEKDQEREKLLEKKRNLKNIFYWKNRATNLMNVKINQDFDLDVLEGVSESSKSKITDIEWLHGLKYQGKWENFKPRLIGEFIFPEKDGIKYDNMKVLGKPKFMFALEDINQDVTPIYRFLFDTYPIYSKIYAAYRGRSFRIDLKGGVTYSGAVNENFEFEGFGTLEASPESKLYWFKREREVNGEKIQEKMTKITGLFLPGKTFLAEFIFKQGQEELQRRLKLVSNVYFKDKDKVEKLYNNILDLKYEPMRMRGKRGTIVEYTGGWKNYMPEGPCSIKLPGHQEAIKGMAQSGIIFKAKMMLSRYNSLKSRANHKNRIKFVKRPLRFKDGSYYYGSYDIVKEVFRGYGVLNKFISKNPFGKDIYEKFKGYWKNSELILNLKYYLIDPSEISKLKEGENEVSLYNGLRFSGTWKEYRFIKGVVIDQHGKREVFDPEKDYLKIKKIEKFDSKLILFNWKTFVYQKVYMAKINKKIIVKQAKDLEPLVDYGMLHRLTWQDIMKKDSIGLTNYTEYPRIAKFLKATDYNYDHLVVSKQSLIDPF